MQLTIYARLSLLQPTIFQVKNNTKLNNIKTKRVQLSVIVLLNM